MKIDTCGMSCPQPVLMVKKALEKKESQFEIIVDNNTAKDNIIRFLDSQNLSAKIEEADEYIYLRVNK
jgi:TusA-related sulfurtransferase